MRECKKVFTFGKLLNFFFAISCFTNLHFRLRRSCTVEVSQLAKANAVLAPLEVRGQGPPAGLFMTNIPVGVRRTRTQRLWWLQNGDTYRSNKNSKVSELSWTNKHVSECFSLLSVIHHLPIMGEVEARCKNCFENKYFLSITSRYKCYRVGYSLLDCS